MNKETGRFIYNEMKCAIKYYDKGFYVHVYKNDEYLHVEESVRLFSVKRYTDGQRDIAFEIANRHILKDIYENKYGKINYQAV